MDDFLEACCIFVCLYQIWNQTRQLYIYIYHGEVNRVCSKQSIQVDCWSTKHMAHPCWFRWGAFHTLHFPVQKNAKRYRNPAFVQQTCENKPAFVQNCYREQCMSQTKTPNTSVCRCQTNIRITVLCVLQAVT